MLLYVALHVSAHEKVLLIGREGEIRGVDVTAPSETLVPTVAGPDVSSPAHIHYLAADYLVYWADTEVGAPAPTTPRGTGHTVQRRRAQVNEIKRARLTGGAVQSVVARFSTAPRGFALDWAARLLYYCAGDALLAAAPAGDLAAELLRHPDLAHLTALVVHPHR